MRPGEKNLITDIKGLKIGNAEDDYTALVLCANCVVKS